MNKVDSQQRHFADEYNNRLSVFECSIAYGIMMIQQRVVVVRQRVVVVQQKVVVSRKNARQSSDDSLFDYQLPNKQETQWIT